MTQPTTLEIERATPQLVPPDLEEVGDLLHDMFMEMRRLTFGKSIISVNVVGSKRKYRMILVETLQSHVICAPATVKIGRLDMKDVQAVFAYTMCNYSVAWMWEILKVLVRGREWRIYETTGYIMKCPLEAYQYFVPGHGLSTRAGGCLHICWLIKLDDGAEFALDLTAAQFGHHRTITPFHEYKAILGFIQYRRTSPGLERDCMEADETTWSQDDEIGRMVTKRLAGVVRAAIEGESYPFDLQVLRKRLGKGYMEEVLHAVFRLHSKYVRHGKRILLRNHEATKKELRLQSCSTSGCIPAGIGIAEDVLCQKMRRLSLEM